MDENMNYCIKKTNILLVEVKMFTRLEGRFLLEEKLRKDERERKVLFYDHMFIDFETGDELVQLIDNDGNTRRPICVNTRYITDIYLHPNPTDQDLLLAAKLYENVVRKKQLIQEKKLIMFPQKKIY